MELAGDDDAAAELLEPVELEPEPVAVVECEPEAAVEPEAAAEPDVAMEPDAFELLPDAPAAPPAAVEQTRALDGLPVKVVNAEAVATRL